MLNQPGKLFVVATPIGNLGDMTPRAVQTLAEVELIAAEDTRHSKPLMNHFGIQTPLLALHDHNERSQTPELVARMQQGSHIALISDAGTPLISDPGYRLVDAAVQQGIEVVAVPGPSAVIAALSIAGLPTDEFGFYGFLPAKQHARVERLKQLAALTHTWVVFESSHRILHAAKDLSNILPPDRQVMLAREITKKFEQSYRGNAAEVYTWLEADSVRQKGEFVLLIEGAEAQAHTAELNSEQQRILELLVAELPLKQAAALAAKITGSSRNALYQYALSLRK